MRSPFPMGKAAIRGCGFSRIVKANTGYVEKKNNDGHSLPLEGKVASGASRIGHWRHEKERERSSQVRRLRKHPSAADAVPFPQWGRQRGGGFAAQKEANPASLRSAAPSKGRGSRGHSLLPMEGGAPKGRRLDEDSGMKKSEGDRLKYAIYESAATPGKAFPAWGRWRAKRAG